MQTDSPHSVGWLIAGSALMGAGLMALVGHRPEAGVSACTLALPLLVLGWRRIRHKPALVNQVEQAKSCAVRLFGKLPASIVLLGAGDRIVFANERARALFGRSEDTWSGQSLSLLTDAKANETDAGLGPVRRFRRGDGTLLYAHVSEAPMYTPESGAGEELRILVVSDVTALVELQHKLQQSERLHAVATMVGQFAHEVRNPVAAISGSAQVLERLQREAGMAGSHHGISEEERILLYQCIVHESDRLDGIISKFLSVADFSDEQLDQLLHVSESLPASPGTSHAA